MTPNGLPGLTSLTFKKTNRIIGGCDANHISFFSVDTPSFQIDSWSLQPTWNSTVFAPTFQYQGGIQVYKNISTSGAKERSKPSDEHTFLDIRPFHWLSQGRVQYAHRMEFSDSGRFLMVLQRHPVWPETAAPYIFVYDLENRVGVKGSRDFYGTIYG